MNLNNAPRSLLLRVPGLGVKNVERILQARRWSSIRLQDLIRLRVPLQKVMPFIEASDHHPRRDLESDDLIDRVSTARAPNGPVRAGRSVGVGRPVVKQITFEPTFKEWQQAARAALTSELEPDQIAWHPSDSQPTLDLFAESTRAVAGTMTSAVKTRQPVIRVPGAFLTVARVVALHSNETKWSLLYRVLWRLTHGEAKLLEMPTDADVIALNHLAKEVNKDAYRMRQYIRFRETQLEGRTWFVAWYEPEHDSVHLNEKFFTDRFTNLRLVHPHAQTVHALGWRSHSIEPRRG